jgi:hypothetical protein
MQHVNVALLMSSYENDNLRLTKNALISLIDVLNIIDESGKKDTKTKRLEVLNRIMEYREQYIIDHNATLFFDSGGYSIIKGDVSFAEIPQVIENYNHLLAKFQNNFDYIFSLDIPWVADQKYRTKKNIYEFNKKALIQSMNILKQQPELIKKYYFVYQFKTSALHKIWTQLYRELDIGKHIIHRSIGGLVGLKGVNKKIENSPFLPMLFKLYYDFINDSPPSDEFRIHVLGVYLPYERFTIAIVEKLLNQLADNNVKVNITYDSTAYSKRARHTFRDIDYYQFAGNQLKTFNFEEIDDDYLREVYKERVTIVRQEINDSLKGERLNDISAFIPMNTYSNLQLDKFFEHIIQYHDILNNIMPTKNKALSQSQASMLIDNLIHYDLVVFSNHNIKRMKNDLMNIAKLWQWFEYDKSGSGIELFINEQIKHINFPYQLS